MFKQTLLRFWFVVPILALVIVLQMGLGLGIADNVAAVPTASPTLRPTFTSTPSPSPTPTNTLQPSPTATPVIKATPSPTSEPTETSEVVETIEITEMVETVETIEIALPTQAATTEQPTPAPSPTATPLPPTGTPTPTIQPTPLGQPNGVVSVPILMYHYLSTPPVGADAIRLDLSVSPDLFENHLAYLREAGYETISFQQLALALSRDQSLPPKPVIITFDDGYRDNYQNAFPLLKQYGYSATFFIFTQPIDTANVDFLSWDMVREMHQAGMEIGSHSHTHPDLRNRSEEFLHNQIVTSKALIEQNLGDKVHAFAYPSGLYDEATIRMVKSADFWAAVTTQWGGQHIYDQRFTLSRVRVRGNDSAAMLAGKLRLVE